MKTIASISYDQTLNDYINSMFSYTFNIGNLSTYTVYDDSTLVAKPTIISNFLPFFRTYSIKVNLEPRYFQKPALFALDYYGASELEWLVLMVSGISHPIDFTLGIIDVLPVSMLTDINKLITLSKADVLESKNHPMSYTSDVIDISRQVGFIEERYLYKNTTNLTENLIRVASRNKMDRGNTSRLVESTTSGKGFFK